MKDLSLIQLLGNIKGLLFVKEKIVRFGNIFLHNPLDIF